MSNAEQPSDTVCPFSKTPRASSSETDELGNFLKLYFSEQDRADQFAPRWNEIETAASRQEQPRLSGPELEHAGRVAWRNSNRCIGRLFWRSLIVRDMRHLDSEDDIFESLVEHLKVAFNGGAIRSVLTVFAPADSGNGDIRIWNHQLVRYAGYGQANRVLGDPSSLEFTEQAMRLGWRTKERSAFDVLPWIIQLPGRRPRVFDLPADVVNEVPLSHPQYAWFEKLGVKWYALPVLSDMCLDAGGQRFTAAPFNGWYMGTEIGTRNLGDESRYNLLPLIAQKMGLNMTSNQSLWKDRALIELNQAVLYSYEKFGVKLVDHHTACQEFMTFVEREKSAGRQPTGDWSWLVPPISGSSTPVFHQHFDDESLKPNFIHQEKSWSTLIGTNKA
jgi:nitric-oxide synthase